MNGEQIKDFLDYVKESLYLHKEEEDSGRFKERFIPYDNWIYLSCNYRLGGDAVAYMDYDFRTKTTKGLNPNLLPKIVIFLNRTSNHHLLKEVKENLQ